MVLDESKYKSKFNILLEPGIYDTWSKDSTAKVERKIQKFLSENKTVPLTDPEYKLTPYHSKHPYLYGLPKVHKPDIPPRPILNDAGHYPLLCLYLQLRPVYISKQRFGDCILCHLGPVGSSIDGPN